MDEFLSLKPKAYKKIIRDSYLYLDDERVSIKKYYETYDGLLRVEVAFSSIEELKNYKKEEWMGIEITATPLAFDKDLSKLDREQFLKELNRNKTYEKIDKDIYFGHTFSENSFERAMILHSVIPIDLEIKDGIMDILFSKNDWYNHHHYFRKYIMAQGFEKEKIRKIRTGNRFELFSTIQFLLNDYQDIIFLDVTDLDDEKKYSNGMFFLPSTITNKQFETLEANISYFEQFNSILIQGGCEIKEIRNYDAMAIHEDIKGIGFEHFLRDTIQELVHVKQK